MVSEDEGEGGAAGSPAEERSLKLWRLSLLFIFIFLAGGGYYAFVAMRQAAHTLACGDNYTRFSDAGGLDRGSAALRKNHDFFAAEETDGGGASGVPGQAPSETNPASPAAGHELSAAAGAAGPAAFPEGSDPADGRAAAAGAPVSFTAKLERRTSGLRGGSAAQLSRTSANREDGSFEGGGAPAGKPSLQRETHAAAPKKNAGGGVLSALKGAFRASFYGARIASNDAARNWLARSFDAAPEAENSIQYDEKMRAKLDRIDPNSIPKFLREQDVSAAEAKTLAVTEVSEPKMDVEGTKEALKNDSGYQAKKLVQDMAAGAINPIGNIFSGANTGRGEGDAAVFPDPEDKAVFEKFQLEEYISTTGYGAECGCTASAPCCCLPQNTVADSCPLYGPFLPNDPCGGYSAGLSGDFPVAGAGATPL